MPQLSQLSHVGLAKEVTLGTYLAPTFYVPTDGQPQPEDIFERVADESYDANAAQVRGIYDGIRDGATKWSGYLYPDIVGNLLAAIGLADVVTGTTPKIHTFKQPAAGGQPPSYSITDFNTFEARAIAGAMLESLTVKVDSKGAAKYDASWKGFPSAIQSTPTPAFGTVAPFLNWQTQLTLGGSASTKGLSAECTIQRASVEQIHTLQNSQSPKTVFAGALDFVFKYSALFEDDTDLNRYLNNTQAAAQLALTVPGGGTNPVLTLLSTVNGFTKATVDRSGDWAKVNLEGRGIYNTTDAGPVQATLTNAITTAY